MTRSLSRPELSALEDQLRDALHQRAASTPIDHRAVVDARPIKRATSAQRRLLRGVLAIGAAAATVAVVVAVTQGGSTPDVGVETTAPASGLPDAEVPRLVIDGATFQSSEVKAPHRPALTAPRSSKRSGALIASMVR